jgi:hypothetical protein
MMFTLPYVVCEREFTLAEKLGFVIGTLLGWSWITATKIDSGFRSSK